MYQVEYLEDVDLFWVDPLVDEDADGGESFGLLQHLIRDSVEAGLDLDPEPGLLKGLADGSVEVTPRVDDEQVLVGHVVVGLKSEEKVLSK